MQILDSLVDGALTMPDKDRDAYLVSLILYLRTGVEPENLKGRALTSWVLTFPVIKNSRSKAENGRKGGRASQARRKASQKQTDKQNEKQAHSKHEANREAESEASTERASRLAPLSYSSSYSLEGINSQPDRSVYPPPTDLDARERKERADLDALRRMREEGRLRG